jgi:uncharacterized hydantoinase/oxoprolinase family protein
MKKTNIQHRIVLNEGEKPVTPENFTMGKDTFTIIGMSEKEDLIPDTVPDGVFFGGSFGQYLIEDQAGKRYEAYIYFYKKFQGTWCAVVDAMEEV